MSATTIIRGATAEGVRLAPTDADTIRVSGNRRAVLRWLPVVCANKQAVLSTLRAFASTATDDPMGDPELQMKAWEQTQALLQRISRPY